MSPGEVGGTWLPGAVRGTRSTWPGWMRLGSFPISWRLAAYHSRHRAETAASDARGPSSRAAMVQSESPSLTTRRPETSTGTPDLRSVYRVGAPTVGRSGTPIRIRLSFGRPTAGSPSAWRPVSACCFDPPRCPGSPRWPESYRSAGSPRCSNSPCCPVPEEALPSGRELPFPADCAGAVRCVGTAVPPGAVDWPRVAGGVVALGCPGVVRWSGAVGRTGMVGRAGVAGRFGVVGRPGRTGRCWEGWPGTRWFDVPRRWVGWFVGDGWLKRIFDGGSVARHAVVASGWCMAFAPLGELVPIGGTLVSDEPIWTVDGGSVARQDCASAASCRAAGGTWVPKADVEPASKP